MSKPKHGIAHQAKDYDPGKDAMDQMAAARGDRWTDDELKAIAEQDRPPLSPNMIEDKPVMDRLREATEGDYYAIHYLKQPEEHSAFVAVTELWPTREEAETKADALREGRHAAIVIKPKRWE